MSGQMFTLVAAADVRHGVSMRREFGIHLENIAPECDFVKLIARDDLMFDVEVIKDFYNPFLSVDGWVEFVDATDIQEGDSVVFVYHGNFCFKAHIFNPTGHEKSFSHCEPPTEISGAVPSGSICDHRVMNGHEALEANDQPSMNLEDGSAPLSNHVKGPSQHSYVLAQGATLPMQMKKSVEEKVQEIGSEIPIYVRKMTESNIFGSGDESTGSQVVYPMAAHHAAQSGFAGGGGEGRSRRLLTDPGRGECELLGQKFTLVAAADVRYGVSMRREFGRHLENIAPEFDLVKLITRDGLVFDFEVIKDFYEPFLSADEWDEFVDATNIQEGDSVMFVYCGNFCFKAHIFNSSDHENSFFSCQRPIEMFGAGPSSTLCDHRVMNAHKAQEANDQASMNLEDGSPPLSDHVGGPLQHSYILAERATLPTQMKKRVEEKVQAIQSNFPIYVKVMTEVSITGSKGKGKGSRIYPLTFCRKFALPWLPYWNTEIVLQVEGKTETWRTMFEVRHDKTRWIHKWWDKFVRGNGLKVGDVCLFEVKEKYGRTLTVHLIRSKIEV